MFIPPYWGLGFQISRWGFKDLDHVKRVVDRNVAAQVPLDSVYGDIDYMRYRQDFTYDKELYLGLPEYVEKLHNDGMRYVIILVCTLLALFRFSRLYFGHNQLHISFFRTPQFTWIVRPNIRMTLNINHTRVECKTIYLLNGQKMS